MPDIHSRIIDRLIDSGHADEPWAWLVLAALEGDQPLEVILDTPQQRQAPQRVEQPATPAAAPPGAYVGAIVVEDREVGPGHD
jgi:hypothetical protein